MKTVIEMDVENQNPASCSATGFIVTELRHKPFIPKETSLIVKNLSKTKSNFRMLSAFFEDLEYLERMGVDIEVNY